MSASPFTSDGYPYPKDLASYAPENLGQAFFTRPDAALAPVGGVHLFDGAALHPTLRASPYRYQGQVVPVYVYTGTDAADLAAHYERLQLGPTQIGLFAWCQAEQVTFQLKLGATLQPLSRYHTATATRRARVVVPRATAQAQAWSASWLLGLFGLANAPLFDPALVGTAAAPTFPLRVKRRQAPAAPAAPPARRKPRQLDVVVGLFFDGTGNNRYATELIYNYYLTQDRKLDEQRLTDDLKKVQDLHDNRDNTLTIPHPSPNRPRVPLKEFMVNLDDDGSTLNAYSNVVLLHDLYQARPYDPRRPSQPVVLKHYVQGIGTLVDLDAEGIPVKYYKDDILGSASGRGLRGVIGRVEQGLAHVASQLQRLQQTSGQPVGSLTIDVFGFSRGATAARHCLNELLLADEENLLQDTVAYGRLGKACKALGVELPDRLNLRFAGLFDTVVSDVFFNPIKRKLIQALALKEGEFASLAYEAETEYENIYTSLKDFKGKAVHLVAGDEYRENFPLTCNDAPNKCDLTMYGAHSDIGGGYAETTYKTLVTYLDVAVDKAAELPGLLAEASARYRQRFTCSLLNGRWQATALGQRRAPERRVYATIGQTYSLSRTETLFHRHFIYDEAYLPNKLALVAMHAMLQCALAEKLPFQPDPRKARVPNLKAYTLPTGPAFQAYYTGVLKLLADPRAKEVNFPEAVYYPLAERYIHESSGYNKSAGFGTPGNNSGLLDFYINKPNAVNKPAAGAAAQAAVCDDSPALSKDRVVDEPLARTRLAENLRLIRSRI